MPETPTAKSKNKFLITFRLILLLVLPGSLYLIVAPIITGNQHVSILTETKKIAN
jgi:hypothetical protein